MTNIYTDQRLVLTLDAGGTNFVFNAIQSGKLLFEAHTLASNSHDLDLCLNTAIQGFEHILSQCKTTPVAISFAFPGPADYPNGIIGDLPNFPSFKGGVALGPMLEERFNLPVFIQNDGNLYAYGEALGGILPEINQKLKDQGSNKSYESLIGLTLGTGFGAGLVYKNVLLAGDNSIAGEVWITSNSINPQINTEEGVSTRAIINVYHELSGTKPEKLMPKDIFDIATGNKDGDKAAALKSFEKFGTHLGDAMANIISLFDGIVVIGGGLTGANKLYMPAAMTVLKGKFTNKQNRLLQQVFLLDDAEQTKAFYQVAESLIKVPFSDKEVKYGTDQKLAIATSKLDASTAIAIGAYAFALTQL